jgi:hypothetical protein
MGCVLSIGQLGCGVCPISGCLAVTGQWYERIQIFFFQFSFHFVCLFACSFMLVFVHRVRKLCEEYYNMDNAIVQQYSKTAMWQNTDNINKSLFQRVHLWININKCDITLSLIV